MELIYENLFNDFLFQKQKKIYIIYRNLKIISAVMIIINLIQRFQLLKIFGNF